MRRVVNQKIRGVFLVVIPTQAEIQSLVTNATGSPRACPERNRRAGTTIFTPSFPRKRESSVFE
jgi:hypothetical protein